MTAITAAEAGIAGSVLVPESGRPLDARFVSKSRVFTIGHAVFVAIVFLAFMLRVWDVGSRAMHLDESTVAWFAWRFLTGNGYTYNPVYHGPFQHEMLALIFLLFQPSQTSARLLAVTLGSGLVALPWFIRDYIGRGTALISCFLLAISPSFVYFGRFERDDTYMEFFTFLMVVCAMRFLRDRRPWQVYATAVAFALAFATKESIYIVAFIFGSFGILYALGNIIASRGAPLESAAKSDSSANSEAGAGSEHASAGWERHGLRARWMAYRHVVGHVGYSLGWRIVAADRVSGSQWRNSLVGWHPGRTWRCGVCSVGAGGCRCLCTWPVRG